MMKQAKTRGVKKRQRVKENKLPEQATELSKAEQKEVKGGTMKASSDTQNSVVSNLKAS
jgi:hypothetical protein